MIEKLCEALKMIKDNSASRLEKIDALSIPYTYKSVFMHVAEERKFDFDKPTLNMMKTIGETKSEVCLAFLMSNQKKSKLIIAYRLATLLDNDDLRLQAIQNIQGVVTETKILLTILKVKDELL